MSMTTLERLRQHRDEYAKVKTQALAQAQVADGAIQALDREIAAEEMPEPTEDGEAPSP